MIILNRFTISVIKITVSSKTILTKFQNDCGILKLDLYSEFEIFGRLKLEKFRAVFSKDSYEIQKKNSTETLYDKAPELDSYQF